MVCMVEYEEMEVLRTLPCLHMFHKGEWKTSEGILMTRLKHLRVYADCIDPWLKSNKTCPICKTPIDVDLESALLASTAVAAADDGDASGSPMATYASGGDAGGVGSAASARPADQLAAPPPQAYQPTPPLVPRPPERVASLR